MDDCEFYLILEKALLLSQNVTNDGIDSNVASTDLSNEGRLMLLKSINSIIQGDFNFFLKQEKVQDVFNNCSDVNTFEEIIQAHLKEILKGPADTSDLDQFYVLLTGVTCFLIFVNVNWMNCNSFTCDKQLIPFYHLDNKEMLLQLTVEESTVYNLVKNPELLLISKIILKSLNQQATNLQTVSWWLMRVLSIHEMILDEKSPVLFRHISDLINKIFSGKFLCESSDWKLKITFHLEAANIMLHFYEMSQASSQMEIVKTISGLNITVTGALGKRTQFQQKPVSQLIVIPEEETVSRPERTNEEVNYNLDLLPKNIALNHDILLNEVEYLDVGEKASMKLFPEEQAALLIQCLYIQQSNPVHELVNEEMMPYIQHVLKQPQIWSIQRKCLILRSKLENKKPKTIERAMTQMEEIVSDYRKGDSIFNFARFYLFFAVKPFPHWEVESELAKLLMSLGCVKNALDVFTRLQMWDEVIACYTLLERKDKAEKIIRDMLQEKETVKLLCLLGDATGDPKHYEEAFKLSGSRSARAQRSLGNYYYYKQNYETALPYFIKSVEINYLQPEIWFSLAYCANHVEDFKLSAKAYRRCVTIEPENFEAWNNLSNSYIQLKEHRKAFSSLQESLKLNYENWHIWENYLIVSADCGEFDEVIKACHRLLDLKEKHVDVEVLGILVKAIAENILDSKNEGCERLREPTVKLFGRITSVVTSNPSIWESYGKLYASKSDKTVEDYDKILHHQQRAHRCLIHDLNWDRELNQCLKVMKQALVLCDTYHTVSEMHDRSLQTLSSCKLMLRGIIKTIEKKLTDSVEENDEIKELLNKIIEKFEYTKDFLQNQS